MGGNRPHRRHDLATCSDVFYGKTVCIRDLGKPNLIWRFNFKFDPSTSKNTNHFITIQLISLTKIWVQLYDTHCMYVVKCNLAKAFGWKGVIFYVPKCRAFYLTLILYRTTYFTRGQFHQHTLAAFSIEQNENLFWRTNLPKFGTVILRNSAQLFGKIQQFLYLIEQLISPGVNFVNICSLLFLSNRIKTFLGAQICQNLAQSFGEIQHSCLAKFSSFKVI